MDSDRRKKCHDVLDGLRAKIDDAMSQQVSLERLPVLADSVRNYIEAEAALYQSQFVPTE